MDGLKLSAGGDTRRAGIGPVMPRGRSAEVECHLYGAAVLLGGERFERTVPVFEAEGMGEHGADVDGGPPPALRLLPGCGRRYQSSSPSM